MAHKTTRIVVAGRLSEGRQLDEAHIHGLIMRLRNLGIEIVSLTTSAADQ